MQKWPGRPYPLGATYDGSGTNFALFSEVAERGASGMVDSVDAKSLTVTWEGGAGKETFQKAEGTLPSGLPTDLTADLPTASAGS